MTTDQVAAALQTAYRQRSEARALLRNTGEALQRGQRVAEAAQASLRKAEQAAADDEARQARELEHTLSAAEGADVPTEAGELVTTKLARARHADAVAMRALAGLQTAHGKAQGDVMAGEVAVAKAVDALLRAEWSAIVDEIQRVHAHLVRLGERLREVLPNAFDHRLPEAVERALALMPRPDPLDTPVNILRAQQAGGWANDGKVYAARRAQLIAGDPEPPVSAVA